MKTWMKTLTDQNIRNLWRSLKLNRDLSQRMHTRENHLYGQINHEDKTHTLFMPGDGEDGFLPCVVTWDELLACKSLKQLTVLMETAYAIARCR